MWSSTRWQSLMESFHNAAIDGELWHTALRGLAEVTGSSYGQLVGLSTRPGSGMMLEQFNLLPDFDTNLVEQHRAADAMNPAVNPRSRAGMAAPLLQSRVEADYLTPEEHRHHPYFREFAHPWDIPFSCLTTVHATSDLVVGLAVVRTSRRGHIDAEQRRRFDAAAPFVRAAVRTQMALAGQARELTAGMLEALRMAAFVCDARGLVVALTPAAEALVAAEGKLQLRGGRFHGQGNVCRALNEAVAAAAARGQERPLFRSVVVALPDELPLVMDVMALPVHDYQLGVEPRVLVVVGRGDRDRADSVGILRTAYGLTTAEADIALGLCQGESTEAIAARRTVTVGTIRVQTKKLLAKLGVRRQAELVARLGQLGMGAGQGVSGAAS